MTSDVAQRSRRPGAVAPQSRAQRWDTPTRFRVALALSVAAGLLLAGSGVVAFTARADAVDRARSEAAHLVTVQRAATRFLSADAQAATNVLLAGAATDSQQRQYRYALDEAALRLVVAARSGDDAYTLAPVGAAATRYAAQVAGAGDAVRNDRQAAGARSLLAASNGLRREVLPPLQQVRSTSSARLDGDLDDAAEARLVFAGSGLSALVILALVQLWLARRTRRVVNPPLLAGTLVVMAVGVGALAVLQRSADAADGVRAGPEAAVTRVVAARLAMFDARSAESRALLASASSAAGRASEQQWRNAVLTARRALQGLRPEADAVLRPATPAERAATPLALLASYESAHERVTSRLAAGDIRDAIAVAADPSEAGAAGSLENLDTATAALLARQVRAVEAGLASAGSLLRVAGWICVLTGLAAAALGWRGVGRRLAEYR